MTEPFHWHGGPAHGGDCVWAITIMRKIPGRHVFYCNPEYHRNLIECCEGRDIELRPESERTADAKCVWIGSGLYAGRGIRWSNQPDVIGFLCAWGNCMATDCGAPVMFERKDFLADFPAINRSVPGVYGSEYVLVINCQPQSGQVPRFDNWEMNELIQELGDRYGVLCTNHTTATNVVVVNESLCKIGSLANRAKFVVAIASGAHWGIHNVFNRTVPIFLLLDPYKLIYDDRHYPTHGLVKLGLREELVAQGLL